MLKGISALTIAQLNQIPTGFNNNIAWHLGHLVASQQGLCYVRAEVNPRVTEIIMSNYRSGTKPEAPIDISAFSELKDLLFSTLDQFEIDYNTNLFANYKPWTTRYDVEIRTIDDALQFLSFHEGLHLGTIQSMQRLVSNEASTSKTIV